MWKEFESHIAVNRQELDRDVPRAEVWTRIETELGASRPRKLWTLPVTWLKVAAMLFAAVGLGYIWHIYAPQQNMMRIEAALPVFDMSEQHPEWDEIQVFYTREMQPLLAELNQYPLEAYPLSAGFKNDVDSIDQQIAMVRTDIDMDGFNEHHVEALADLCEVRLDIMKTWLTAIKNSQPNPQI